MELLAPAGEFESLVMAVQNGADAVYVGGSAFSARRGAANFDLSELAEAVDYCHLRGVRLYLAVNTLIKEAELRDVGRYLEAVYKIGVDAVIVQDWGVLRLVRRCLPELPVNGSTQMSVNNADGVRTLASLGVRRVVLARELSGKEIADIRAKTDIELEMFVHGALCMSYSGQCLMSSMLGGRSGNRGACAQPCRLPYTLLENGRPTGAARPLLSPKDLCLAKRISEVRACGVDSLKIEGRMKSPEYVGMVTRVYRAALSGGADSSEVEDMLRFFSRGGSSAGYFDGRRFRAMMDYGSAAKISADRDMEKRLRAESAEKTRTRPVTMELLVRTDEPLRLLAQSDGFSAEVTGDKAERAQKRPTEPERLRAQLEKLGGTPFHSAGAVVDTDGVAAVSVSAVNALRREAAGRLADAICASFRRRERAVEPEESAANAEPCAPTLCVEVQTEEQYRAVKKMGVGDIRLPYGLYRAGLDPEAVCVLPDMPRQGETPELFGAARVMVNNIGQFECAGGREILGGHRLNLFNGEAAEQLIALGARGLTASPELNLSELKRLAARCRVPLEVIAYGRLPLMLMENCVIRSASSCACKTGRFSLRDRKGVEFPLIARDCRNVLLNSRPVYMADRLEDIKSLQIARIRLSFSVENPDLCCIIISDYQEALAGRKLSPPEYDYTRGHFYRGVL